MEKRRLQRNLIIAFKYLMEDDKQDVDQHFIQIYSDWIRGKIFKLKEGSFRLDIRGKILLRQWWSTRLASDCECLIWGSVQYWMGWMWPGPGQPDAVLDLAVGNCAHSRKVGTRSFHSHMLVYLNKI